MDTLHDQTRGHWGKRPGAKPGTFDFCACPIPPESPAARIGDEADVLRYLALGERFVDRSITEAELDEYAALWNRAYPRLGPWLRPVRLAA